MLVLAAVGSTLPAQAHGPAPAALGVATHPSDTTPAIVRLSRGVALQQDDGWQYVCPAAWNGPEAPLCTAAGYKDIPWLVSTTGLRRVLGDGTTRFVEGSEQVTSATVRSMVPWKTSVIALTGFGKPSTLWQLSGNTVTPIWQPDSTWQTIVGHGEQVVAAAIQSGQLALAFVSFQDAEPTVSFHMVGEGLEGTPSLRSAGGALFVRLHNEDQFTLYRLDEVPTLSFVVSSPEPIHGPIGGEGDNPLFISLHHQMATLGPSGAVPWENDERITCLGSDGNDKLYACVFPNLVTILPVGQLGAPLFELTHLRPPVIGVLTEGQQALCELDWLDFASDAGLPLKGLTGDVLTDTTGSPGPSKSSGCQQHDSSSLNALFVLIAGMWGLFAIRRRRLPAPKDGLQDP
jgi:hypothetical protein